MWAVDGTPDIYLDLPNLSSQEIKICKTAGQGYSQAINTS